MEKLDLTVVAYGHLVKQGKELSVQQFLAINQTLLVMRVGIRLRRYSMLSCLSR